MRIPPKFHKRQKLRLTGQIDNLKLKRKYNIDIVHRNYKHYTIHSWKKRFPVVFNFEKISGTFQMFLSFSYNRPNVDNYEIYIKGDYKTKQYSFPFDDTTKRIS